MTPPLRRPASGRVKSPEVEAILADVRQKRVASSTSAHRFRFLWGVLASNLTQTEKLLAVALMLHADNTGGGAHPGQARLAALVGVAREAVRRGTRALEAMGFIMTKTGSGKQTTRYVCQLPQALLDGESPATPLPSEGESVPLICPVDLSH